MNNQNIQIIRLGPMRVASVSAFGYSPEAEAWMKLKIHAEPKGWLKDRNEHPVFGFSNGSSSALNDKFGYELWIKVDSEVEPEGEMRIFEFPGGPYAVLRRHVKSLEDVRKVSPWQDLEELCRNRNIKPGYHQYLEKFVSFDDRFENLILDLYYPIIY